ncbi:unnamed protein product [Caenorhabditis auriculariae]|uniref:RNA-directed RNA polymerase n=1 Tax=Caenorhabditis auriculariae TaxID=2777116 RepID=A0A8S1GU22_9PELO|nr:unnamed protein product [Caenorhabditis auriculariae]
MFSFVVQSVSTVRPVRSEIPWSVPQYVRWSAVHQEPFELRAPPRPVCPVRVSNAPQNFIFTAAQQTVFPVDYSRCFPPFVNNSLGMSFPVPEQSNLIVQKNVAQLKFEIPIHANESEVRFQDLSSSPELFPHFSIRVVSRHEIREDGDPYVVITYELSSVHKLDKRFLQNLLVYYQKSFIAIQRMICRADALGTLILHDSELFNPDFIFKYEVNSEYLKFGNILNGCFYNHWEVPLGRETGHRLQSGKQMKNTFFEFANRHILTFHFDNYRVSVFPSTIRRIVCDLMPSADSSGMVRLYFFLLAPPTIRYSETGLKSFENFARCTSIKLNGRESHPLAISDSPVLSVAFYVAEIGDLHSVLSRFRFKLNIGIEFTLIKELPPLIYYINENPYHKWTRGRKPTDPEEKMFRWFLWEAFNEFSTENNVDPNPAETYKRRKARLVQKILERRFSYIYLIECLLSRGAVVKDQLLLDEGKWLNFLQTIIYHYDDDEKHEFCESALQKLIQMIDQNQRIKDISQTLRELCTKHKNLRIDSNFDAKMYDNGYRRVRKVILTPTRMILSLPEIIMGNRALREFDFDGTMILRVNFRDDDMRRMYKNELGDLLSKTVMGYLTDGIVVCGFYFNYFGSSCSQMRDTGGYFMLRISKQDLKKYKRENGNQDPPPSHKPRILHCRQKLGRFDEMESIPKVMARLGQCFTQAREAAKLGRQNYFVLNDDLGGRNISGKPYTFTDGVGIISEDFAWKLALGMRLGPNLPSAFQFRFRGMKGVLVVEPLLDEIRDWAAKDEVLTQNGPQFPKSTSWQIDCVFRPSQIKFITAKATDDFYPIEVVKFSSTSPVTLNRPLINILDQVSEMQSYACHRRVCNRIEELLDMEISTFAKLMGDENRCRERIKEMTRRVNVDVLKRNSGFMLTTEPFFRSLIKAAIRAVTERMLRKTKIPIPYHLGRTMYGVSDETGRLQYGQVFVQYTKNIHSRNNRRATAAQRQIVCGPVMITKSPSVCEGDVRMFDAVDIPELRHLCDVVVFPKHGPRPHADEMAGSDLDGDEYAVMWDRELFLERNQPAFHFDGSKAPLEYDPAQMDKLMNEFYIRYMEQDSVGTLSLNHLHQSDQYGLNSEVCMNLAAKLSQALDFAKSGVAPPPATKEWQVVNRNGVEVKIPPEYPEMSPDFSCNSTFTTYASPGLLGKLYRRTKAIEEVVRTAEEKEEQVEVQLDEMILVDGWQKYADVAKQEMVRYNACLQAYGVATEAELFSGCYIDLRNRINERETDSISYFSTDQIIDEKVTLYFKTFREEFFGEFGGHLAATESENPWSDDQDALRRVCRSPSEEMMQKAVAYYRCCYEEASKSRNKKLSFAWIAFDVLQAVRQKAVLAADKISFSADPLLTMIKEHRESYCLEKTTDLQKKFFSDAQTPSFDTRQSLAADIIQKYLDRYPGLEKVLFIVLKWAETTELFKTRLKRYHCALLLIMFGANLVFPKDPVDSRDLLPFFEPIEIKEVGEKTPEPLVDEAMDRLTVDFLRFLSSQAFRNLTHLSFLPVGFRSVFVRKEWLPYHLAATRTFYNLLLNMRFDELPLSTDAAVVKARLCRDIEPFSVHLPSFVRDLKTTDFIYKGTVNLRFIEMAIKMKTEVEIIRMKQMKLVEGTARCVVTARGTFEQLNKLKKLLAMEIPRHSFAKNGHMLEPLAHLCFEKITKMR